VQLTKQRILCVDDNDDTRLMLSVLLGQAGYEVRQAGSFAEGLSLAKGERFDLYLLDGIFADGMGLELCRRIREFDARTPMIFFSGLAYEADRQRGLDAGAQAYLIKPNDISKLVETATRLTININREANSRPAPSASAFSQ
jgi:two-component system, NtrC family, response regulator AtoC